MQLNHFFTSVNYLKQPQDLRQRERRTPVWIGLASGHLVV
jgi:hypothetical protein